MVKIYGSSTFAAGILAPMELPFVKIFKYFAKYLIKILTEEAEIVRTSISFRDDDQTQQPQHPPTTHPDLCSFIFLLVHLVHLGALLKQSRSKK